MMRLIIGLFFLGMGALVNAAPDGHSLYATHCAVCHGEKGGGSVGIPLALPSFLDSVDDDFLRKSIRYGRPGRVMPAFSKLSDAQLVAIIGHIRSWSEQSPPEFTTAPVSGDPAHGKELFAAHCASCHGEHGEGGKGTGVTFSRQRDLPIIAPALNNTGFLAAASDALIRHTLVHGREATPMQSFLEQGLSEPDIDDLVSYIRSFETPLPEAGEVVLAGINPVLVTESSYPLEETVENLKQAITGQNFLLIRTEFFEHGLVAEGEESPREVVLHFCNFRLLYEALAIDPRVGMFLPCRVNVIERAGKVEVMSINPVFLSHMFNNEELHDACREMTGIYEAIIEDATL